MNPPATTRAERAVAVLFVLLFLGLALHVHSLEGGKMLRSYVRALYAAGALVALGVCFAPQRWRRRALAILVGATLTLAAAEALEARFGPFAPVRTPPGYDRRTKLDVVLAMRAEGIDAVPSIPCTPGDRPALLNGQPTMPLAGISRAVTVHDNDNETGEYKVLFTDRHGFANPESAWEHVSLDVALIGDSFTFGASVLEDRSFAELIRARHPACLNLGIAGMGPLHELAALREYLPPFRPRVVLWFFYEGNDVADLAGSVGNPVLRRYLEPEYVQGLAGRQAEIDAHLRERVEALLSRSEPKWSPAHEHDTRRSLGSRLELQALQRHLMVLARGQRGRSERDAEPVPFPTELFRRILASAQQETAAFGGELAFVYLPTYRSLARRSEHEHRAGALAVARELGLPIIDLDPIFRAHPKPLSLWPAIRQAHYGEEGNVLVATEVLRFLSEGR